MKGLLSNDGDVKEVMHYDAHDDQAYIQRVQDVSSVLDHNREKRDSHNRYKSEVFNHKARIPTTIAEQWCKAQGLKYSEFLSNPDILKRFLNDPDNAPWLTIKGRI